MAQSSVSKPTASAVVFVLNQQRGPQYNATLQNLTGASITIQVTNQNIQDTAAPTFTDPAAGILTSADEAVGFLSEPYEAIEIDGAGTGTIEIVEAG